MFSKTSFLTLTFDQVTWKSIGVIFTVIILNTLKENRSKDFVRSSLIKDLQFYLDLWPCHLKINGIIYSLRAFTLPSLANFKQMGQKVFFKHLLYTDQKFNLSLWLSNQKFNREHRLSWSSTSTIFISVWFVMSMKLERWIGRSVYVYLVWNCSFLMLIFIFLRTNGTFLHKKNTLFLGVYNRNVSIITRRNATIPWKLKGAIQSPFSHHSVDWMACAFQWPFSAIQSPFRRLSVIFNFLFFRI